LKAGEVALDIEGESVQGDAVFYRNAQGGDFFVLDPDANLLWFYTGVNTDFFQGKYQRLFHPFHETAHPEKPGA